MRVFAKRIGAVGWRAELLGHAPSAEDLLAMRLHAIVLDPTLLGNEAWTYLERLGSHPAAPAIVVVTRPDLGCAAGARAAAGRRRLGDEALPSRRGAGAGGGCGAGAARAPRATAKSHEPVIAGELEIKPDMFEAFVGGRAIGLTRREFELVHLLAEHQGRVIQRERIYERVWGYAMAHGDRSVDVFVRKLRKKLESASPGWRYLHTHFGVGYRFEPEAKEDVDLGAAIDEGENEGLPPAPDEAVG